MKTSAPFLFSLFCALSSLFLCFYLRHVSIPSLLWVTVCFSVVLSQFILYLAVRRGKMLGGLINPLITFSLSFIVVYFQFVYCYLLELELGTLMLLSINSETINYSVSLAALAYSVFIAGYHKFAQVPTDADFYLAQPDLSNQHIRQIIINWLPFHIALNLLFFMLVGRDFLFGGHYDAGASWGRGSNEVATLISVAICVLVALETWRLQWRRPTTLISFLAVFDKKIMILSLVWIFPFVVVGDRGTYLSIIFCYIASYALVVKPLSLGQAVTVFIALAVFAVVAVSIRQTGQTWNQGRFWEGLGQSKERLGFRLNDWPTMELAYSYRCWNVAIEIADEDKLPADHFPGKYNLTWSTIYLPPLVNRFFDPFNDDEFKSPPGAITYYIKGHMEGSGSGSVSLAAPYFDFGILGIIIIPLLYGIGYAVVENMIRQKNSIYTIFIFIFCVYSAIYVNRSEFYLVLRCSVWGCILLYVLVTFSRKKTMAPTSESKES